LDHWQKKTGRIPENNILSGILPYKRLKSIEPDYPHHPQPKLAIKRIQKTTVTIRYLSSEAIIYPPLHA